MVVWRREEGSGEVWGGTRKGRIPFARLEGRFGLESIGLSLI